MNASSGAWWCACTAEQTDDAARAGIDIGFQYDGDAVQRPARALISALDIEGFGDCPCVRVYLDDRTQLRPGAIDRRDAFEIVVDEFTRRQFAAVHCRL